jgi:hypothetical protein
VVEVRVLALVGAVDGSPPDAVVEVPEPEVGVVEWDTALVAGAKTWAMPREEKHLRYVESGEFFGLPNVPFGRARPRFQFGEIDETADEGDADGCSYVAAGAEDSKASGGACEAVYLAKGRFTRG